MRLACVCISGGKECCGCGKCYGKRTDSGENTLFCGVCRVFMEEEEIYLEPFYGAVCLSCLKHLHRVG